ncbi:PD-(D/E)XK nuclease family protein [Gordonia sp. (in: high G+C Gram-positive bacteria)]|uniref:PD-(D/E)XK nuclease family protein n=1 Tax=Gordonia sp. (in: high G+C Gram-positive bacteria) TaxID=84139 RepID=UPI0039E5049A
MSLDALDAAIAPTFKDELIGMLREFSDSRPRSLQTRLGPSELGHPCDKKMALALADAPRCNASAGDPLPSLLGSAGHSLMEQALAAYNETYGQRFLIEQKVSPLHPAEAFAGTMDCYDLHDDAVIDWKFAGARKMTDVRRDNDPGILYRTQAHVYALGCERTLGVEPKKVRIVFLPRAGFSTGAVVWEESYDRDRAEAAIDRVQALLLMVDDLRAVEHPERFDLFPTTPLQCEYCPFHRPQPTGPHECAGG